jgi:uncharacterized phage protein gp47/JayE
MSTNAIGPSGLTLQTYQEIVTEILDGATDFPGMRTIYGADINVDPNSPDGQMVNIVALAKTDVLGFLQQIYNSFDPDKAVGVSLNSRCAINGIARRAGTRTLQDVDVTVSQALTLQGLDLYPTDPFTVSDGSGNQYQLLVTQNPAIPSVVTAQFQAVLLGPVQSAANTITVPVTIQLGVSSVNNPTIYTTLGVAEETDYALRVRRQQSVALPNQGYIDGLISGLVNTPGVLEVKVFENATSSPDANGTNPNTIWCIVMGGTNLDVATTIYRKRNAGCGMRGGIAVLVPQLDGSNMTIRFDRQIDQLLYISFDVSALSGLVDDNYIRQQILLLLSYNIGQSADVTTIVALVRQIAPNAQVVNQAVGLTASPASALVNTTAVNYRFVIASNRIRVNGVYGP